LIDVKIRKESIIFFTFPILQQYINVHDQKSDVASRKCPDRMYVGL